MRYVNEPAGWTIVATRNGERTEKFVLPFPGNVQEFALTLIRNDWEIVGLTFDA